MTTLVTGATGLVGNNVVRLLLERGDSVRVLVRPTSDPRPLAGLDIQRALGDVSDPDSLHKAMQGIERVVHGAGHVQVGWSGQARHREVNVVGTRNVAAAARQAGAKMVHVSSTDALGLGTRQAPGDEESPLGREIECPYVLTKRGAEREVHAEIDRGLWAAIVNPCYLLGPWDWKPSSGRMLLAVARGAGLLAPSGGNDFCDVRDVAEGILAAFERGKSGRRYVLGGEALSYFEAWTLFARVTGARAPLATVPAWMSQVAGRTGSLLGRVTGHEPDINSAATAIAALPHHFSCRRAQQELGYTIRGAETAAQAAWEWFQQRGYR